MADPDASPVQERVSWDAIRLEIQCVERDCLVAGARFDRLALEQEAMNAELERDPNISHDIMKSVLSAFREFAEAKETLELQLATAHACRAAHEGDVNAVMQWVELRQKRGPQMPPALRESLVTPLHCAALGGRLECVSMLLTACKVGANDRYGMTAAQLAASDEIAALLKESAAENNDE